MRPVFLRIEPTFESSFFGSLASFEVAVLAVFTDAFLAGAVAGCLVGAGFGSSAGAVNLTSLRGLRLRSGIYFRNRNRRGSSGRRCFDDRLHRLPLRGHVIHHAENEDENQCGKGWNGTISARLWFGGNGRQRVVIGQISGIKNQQIRRPYRKGSGHPRK